MELRKDYLLDKWVVISEGRKARPKQFAKEKEKKNDSLCYFCPGNEHLTPEEISRFPKSKEWQIRVFPNKFPAVQPEGMSEVRTDNTFFTFSNSNGEHEVIVETPDHEKQLWNLSKDELRNVFLMYKERIEALYKRREAKYITVFKNHGKDAGTSLVHSHTQIASLNIVPALIREEIEAVNKHDRCPYCDILNIEKGSYRHVFENSTFVAFTPYASRFNYEIWVFPKKHVRCIRELNEGEFTDLSEIMHKIMKKLKELDASFNYFLHISPKDGELHFHIEITPRLATWAGFEFSTDIIINSVPPEEAAAFYRGEQKL